MSLRRKHDGWIGYPLVAILFVIALALHSVLREAATLFIAAGIACNRLVMRVNGGKMPVFNTSYKIPETETHIAGGPYTRLRILSDWIDMGRGIVSIGDVLLILGAVVELGCLARDWFR